MGQVCKAVSGPRRTRLLPGGRSRGLREVGWLRTLSRRSEAQPRWCTEPGIPGTEGPGSGLARDRRRHRAPTSKCGPGPVPGARMTTTPRDFPRAPNPATVPPVFRRRGPAHEVPCPGRRDRRRRRRRVDALPPRPQGLDGRGPRRTHRAHRGLHMARGGAPPPVQHELQRGADPQVLGAPVPRARARDGAGRRLPPGRQHPPRDQSRPDGRVPLLRRGGAHHRGRGRVPDPERSPGDLAPVRDARTRRGPSCTPRTATSSPPISPRRSPGAPATGGRRSTGARGSSPSSAPRAGSGGCKRTGATSSASTW